MKTIKIAVIDTTRDNQRYTLSLKPPVEVKTLKKNIEQLTAANYFQNKVLYNKERRQVDTSIRTIYVCNTVIINYSTVSFFR
jgi:hypothetical protein